MLLARASSRGAAALLLLLGSSAAAPVLAGTPERGSEAVLSGLSRGLNESRAALGRAGLERRAELDAAAAAQARRLCELDPGRRMVTLPSVEEVLRSEGLCSFRRAREVRLMLPRRVSASRALGRWREEGAAWHSALEPWLDALGLATGVTADGWRVVVVVLVQDEPDWSDLEALEGRALAGIAEARSAAGLAVLEQHAQLTEIARSHSQDMARRGYYSHSSPEGEMVADRLRKRGLAYRSVAENIARNRGTDDPVRAAVDGWLHSPPHLANILDPDFSYTGLGIARDAEGAFVFTQVFFDPLH